MWFRNSNGADWHYSGSSSESNVRRSACGKLLFIRTGTENSPVAGNPACARCAEAADRLSPGAPENSPTANGQATRTRTVAQLGTQQKHSKPVPSRPHVPAGPQSNSILLVPSGAQPAPAAIQLKPCYCWVRENADSTWHYLSATDTPYPVCGAAGTYSEVRYNIPPKIARCHRCTQEAARLTRERDQLKRATKMEAAALSLTVTTTPGAKGSLTSKSFLRKPPPNQVPPPKPVAVMRASIERLAAAGRALSKFVEAESDRSFADAFAKLARIDQEIINTAVQQRQWSDLFLSPAAQSAAQLARAENKPPERSARAWARRKRHAKLGRPSKS